MFRHVLKLTWNRRRANALVAFEVTAVFLVIFSLASVYFGLWRNYRRPLGFEWENVWEINLSVSGAWVEEDAERVFQALDALRALPEVEAAHAINITPFRNWNWTSHLGTEDDRIRTWINFMSAGGPADLGVELLEGRWFGPEDEGQDYEPVVVNRLFRDRIFGPDTSPLGMNIRHPDPDDEDQDEYIVVGVMDDFRQRGEFFQPIPYALGMYREGDAELRANFLYVELVPGTPAVFEETVLQTVQGIAPDWGLSVHPWNHFREAHHRGTLMPLYIMSTVAGFLLLMVALGLIGVLWQEVVRRTQEIGLRRALGAPTRMIRQQISLELMAVAGLGILLGAVLGLQLPMLDLVRGVTWETAPVGLVASSLVVLVLVFLASLYPSFVASRSTPAEALRHD